MPAAALRSGWCVDPVVEGREPNSSLTDGVGLRADRPGNWPVVVNSALLHMVAFAALVAVGLQLIPAGRSVVLGYTAPRPRSLCCEAD
jgi:drug/metabolite transporter (DMT)-like permease